MDYHQFAYDTHLFIKVRDKTIQSDLSVVDTCTTTVKQWLVINELLLNADKSEVMFFGTSTQLKSTPSVNVNVVTVVHLYLSPLKLGPQA